MQEVVNLSDRERIRIGKQALSDTLKVLAKHNFDDENTALFVANLIKVFVSADRECNQEEYDIVRDIIGTDISEEDFYEMTNGGADPDFVAAFDRVIDCLTRDEKTPLYIIPKHISNDDFNP